MCTQGITKQVSFGSGVMWWGGTSFIGAKCFKGKTRLNGLLATNVKLKNHHTSLVNLHSVKCSSRFSAFAEKDF